MYRPMLKLKNSNLNEIICLRPHALWIQSLGIRLKKGYHFETRRGSWKTRVLQKWNCNLYSYYFMSPFWPLRPNSSLSFWLRDLKFSAKFAVVQTKTLVKFVFWYHPHCRLQAQKSLQSRSGGPSAYFQVWPPQPAPGLKRSLQSRSGGPFA